MSRAQAAPWLGTQENSLEEQLLGGAGQERRSR